MDLYSTKDFRLYVKWRLQQLPGKEKELKSLAVHTRIHVTQITQILNGKREPTLDQAYLVAKFLKLDSKEHQYFMTLVQLSRASEASFKNHLNDQLEEIKNAAFKNESGFRPAGKFGKQQREIFFSSWYYSAVYLMTSIPNFQSVDAIAQKLSLSRALIRQVLEFLTNVGLCANKDGEFKMSTNELSAGNEKSLRNRHRLNWRLKASESIFKSKDENKFFTHNVSISRKDVKKISGLIQELQEKVDSVIANTKPEVVFCLNYDWFEVE